MPNIHHALVLNLHQPPGNLETLLVDNEWEVKEILYAYDRIPRALWGYEDIARVHISTSGTLLETLSNPEFQSRVYGMVDCGALLWHWQNQKIIEILGTGYYHPVFPLIPEADREEHLIRWQGIARHLFWRENFKGFWPPEMGFSMELIPLLQKLGYRYVIVDSEHVEAIGSMSWAELRYRPHIARFEGSEIIVIVRDRELSDAQESGMEFNWFLQETTARTQHCDFEPLITTCTDGENGGWFRNTTEGSNFFSAFYKELLEHTRKGGAIRPSFIGDYIDKFGVHGEINVKEGAWNTGWHHGKGFTQWTGSDLQKQTLTKLKQVSDKIHTARNQPTIDPIQRKNIEEAFWYLLRAETSCNFYWGEDWVYKSEADLQKALDFLA